MILRLDYTNAACRIGADDGKKTRWISGSPSKSGFPVLARAIKTFGLERRRPAEIAVSIGQDASWSTMRAAVATANAMGFAWGVPVNGKKMAYPAYGGEPNITMPKSQI